MGRQCVHFGFGRERIPRVSRIERSGPVDLSGGGRGGGREGGLRLRPLRELRSNSGWTEYHKYSPDDPHSRGRQGRDLTQIIYVHSGQTTDRETNLTTDWVSLRGGEGPDEGRTPSVLVTSLRSRERGRETRFFRPTLLPSRPTSPRPSRPDRSEGKGRGTVRNKPFGLDNPLRVWPEGRDNHGRGKVWSQGLMTAAHPPGRLPD